MTLGLLALQFLLCAALIAGAGYVLCQSAYRIAKATGMTALNFSPWSAHAIETRRCSGFNGAHGMTHDTMLQHLPSHKPGFNQFIKGAQRENY